MKVFLENERSFRRYNPILSFHQALRFSVSLLLLFIVIGVGYAQQSRVDQLSDDQIVDFYRRAQASGMNELQIEQAAMSQGYTLTDIAKMRQRIAKMRTQSSGKDSSGQQTSDTLNGRTLPGNLSKRAAFNDSLLLARRDTVRKPVVFGASLFQNANISFEPNLRIATPRTYQIGPDDELVVEIYGNSSDNFRLRVSPEGSIRVLNLGPVYVSGLTIEQAEQRIVSRLRQAYSSLNRPGSGTYATITLGNIRSINVVLVGEVVRPGTYTVPSLATAFNALYLAGGPNPETGSFRNIRIIRNNRLIRTIDLYDFLLRADKKDDIRLQDQDVIRVDDYTARVEVAGEVKRPAIYEVKPGETLKTLLAFAGNFNDRAYTASLTLRRNTPRELRIESIPLESAATFIPQAGDKYTIGTILNRYENRVQINGAVMRPGDYALDKDITTLRSLIRRAEGLRKDAFMNRGLIYRERENMDLESIAFDVGKLLRNEVEDIPLVRQDSVQIFSVRDLRQPYTVVIEGAVNKPDTFQFVNNLSVADLITLAGGFQEGATPTRVELARRIREDTASQVGQATVQMFRFNIDRNLQLSPEDARVILHPFDIVYVRTSPQYEMQQAAYIAGEVVHPGSYAVQSRKERISDLIERAGGLKPEAFLQGAQFSRRGELVAIDIDAILNNPGVSGNLQLRDGDTLVIPKRQEIVRIQGAVLNPSTVNYERRFNYRDYITQAGGFTDNARKRKAYVVYANGLKDRSRRFLFFTSRPKVDPGSTVIVPFKPTDDRRLSPAERIGIFSTIGTLTITMTTVIINLLRRP